ncbi:MAG: GH36 C-terminal domain-containing protein, partial [Oscillospiraceae bacterium]|nr:GH36 C-terminal domain-containing protein [Oscillospiraceae bacterium]
MYADSDSANEIKGAVFLFKPSEVPGDFYRVTLRGLDENTVYQLVFEDRPEQNFSASGKTLMTDGFDVEIKLVGSEIIWITEAE